MTTIRRGYYLVAAFDCLFMTLDLQVFSYFFVSSAKYVREYPHMKCGSTKLLLCMKVLSYSVISMWLWWVFKSRLCVYNFLAISKTRWLKLNKVLDLLT